MAQKLLNFLAYWQFRNSPNWHNQQEHGTLFNDEAILNNPAAITMKMKTDSEC